jgi:hypothetical protein
MSLALSSQNWIFAYQNVACNVSSDWQLENHKSDTVRGSYELLTGGCRSCRRLASWCNHFRAFFISLASSSQNRIFFYQNVAYDVSFDGNWNITSPIVYEGGIRFLLQAVALVGGCLLAVTSFVFYSCLWPRLLKIGSLHIKM